MADSKRAEKLSAARKMLKQYQQKNKNVKEASNDTEFGGKDDTICSNDFDNTASTVPSNVLTSGNGFFYKSNTSQDADTTSLPSSKGSLSNVCTYFSNQENGTIITSDPGGPNFFDQVAVPSAINLNGYTIPNFSNGVFSEQQCFVPQVQDSNNIPPFLDKSSQEAELIALNEKYVAQYNEALEKIKWYEQELETVKLSLEQRLKLEVDNLQEKIHLQLKSIEMALSEKMELQRQLEPLQEELKEKRGSCEELTSRLKASRNHVAKLEKELSDVNEAKTQHNAILKRLESSLQEHKATADEYRHELEDAKLEIKELRRNIESSVSDQNNLQKKLEEKESQLSLALIKIQQLGGSDVSGIVCPTETKTGEEIQRLNQQIADLVRENEQNAAQYLEYINSLNFQIQETTSKYERSLMEKDELNTRVQNLVSHISDLEKQIQKQAIPNSIELIEKNNELKQELEKVSRKVKEVEEALMTQRADNVELKMSLLEKDGEVMKLEGRLEQVSGEVPDAKLLQAAMESDKVAAARAITQNNQLKQQLQELQDAFIKLQNCKLELTEQLDQQKFQCNELRNELSNYIKQEVSRSDGSTEMIRIHVVDGCSQTTYHDLDAFKSGESGLNVAVTPEAAAMLEDKFKCTMNRLAELSEEKQRLEHLVTQLQGETETIGEYIALYQTQRCKLEQRASEKDRLVDAVSKEKEELRAKLAEITALIPSLLNSDSTQVPQSGEGEEKVEAEKADVAASKIMTLLTEIGTSTLVNESNHLPDLCISSFHPCSLCSGRLITV